MNFEQNGSCVWPKNVITQIFQSLYNFISTLAHHNISIVLITDDRDNRMKASKLVQTCSIKEYVDGMKDSTSMLDKLNAAGSDGNPDINKKFLFPEHLSPSQINTGIKAKKLFQGVFYLSRTNFQEGTVNCESFDQPILIQGRYLKIWIWKKKN